MRFSPISKHCCFQGNSQERKAYLIRLWDSCESHFPLLLWLPGGSEKIFLRCLVLDFFRLQKDCTDPFPRDYSFPTLLFSIYPFSLILYLLGIIWVLKILSRKMFQCWLFWTSSCALWSDWSIILVGRTMQESLGYPSFFLLPWWGCENLAQGKARIACSGGRTIQWKEPALSIRNTGFEFWWHCINWGGCWAPL